MAKPTATSPGSAVQRHRDPTHQRGCLARGRTLRSRLGLEDRVYADLSTLNPDNFANGSRYWGELKNAVGLPWLGNVKTRLFGAYRYRTWNGSSARPMDSAFGGFAEQKGPGMGTSLANDYLWRDRRRQLPG